MTTRRTIAAAAACLAGGLAVPAARADLLIEDFSSSFFASFESAAAPFHEAQDLTVDGAPAVRTASALSFFNDPGTILVRVTNAFAFEFIPSGTPGGARVSVGWFGDLARGYPAEGPGTVTPDDVEPLDPLLDLSGENAFEIDVTLVAGAATLQVYTYGSGVTNDVVDQSSGIPLVAGAQTVTIDFADFIDSVDPGAIGGLGFVLVTDGDAHVRVDRVEAVSNCVGDFDGSGAIGFSDLNAMLTDWGPCAPPCPSDLDGNGAVGFGDLNALLTAWGACP